MCVQLVTTKEDIMPATKIFQNGNSQALRIPKELRTEKKDYLIQKIGDIFVAYPADDPWAPLRKTLGTFPPDYMTDRDQPTWEDVEKHEDF